MDDMTTIEHAEPGGTELSPAAVRLGARLDEHHAPETNGWMAVCRRCGVRTDGPKGGHTPSEQQLARAQQWLDGQVLNSSIARLKSRRDT
jgi:hypothetical protein